MQEFGIEEMRSCMLEAFRQGRGTQYVALKETVGQIAQQRGLLPPSQPGWVSAPIPDRLWRRFRDVLWGLIIEGVVAIGSDSGNDEWPWLSVTEYGQECLKQGQLIPHDPSGYMRTIHGDRAMDSEELRFLGQALECFQRNLPDACAVMLGCASEHLLLILGEAWAKSDPTRTAKTEKKMSGPALGLLKHLNEELQNMVLPRKLAEQRSTNFDGIAQLIRTARNDAGHPSLGLVDRDQCFVHLRLFREYRRWVAAVLGELGV